MLLRLDKFLSEQTPLSRSDIKKKARKSEITVDGSIVLDTSVKIDPDTVKVTLSGKEITYKKNVYYIMNKPKGVISATEDGHDKTVIDLLREEDRLKGIFPAGRLDKDTTGMVLLTNDGDLSHRILSPKRHIPKYYIVQLAESFDQKYVKLFNDGLRAKAGEQFLPSNVKGLTNHTDMAFIELFEGKFHQIKIMFELVGNKVVNLRRVQMGNLKIPIKLGLGEYVEIMHKETERLFVKPDFSAVFGEIEANFSSYWINI